MDVKLPPLGEGADSGTVVSLFVKEGDQITRDQPILELENEKAVATIPSTSAGTVTKLFVKAGDKLSVGQRILALSETGAAAPSPTPKPEIASKADVSASQPAGPAGQEQDTLSEEAPAPSKPGVTPAAAPSIRKVARELGIDLTRVRG